VIEKVIEQAQVGVAGDASECQLANSCQRCADDNSALLAAESEIAAAGLLPQGSGVSMTQAPATNDALLPTGMQLSIAETARDVKVFVYDLAGAGVQPPLSAAAGDSPACNCGHSLWNNLVATGFPTNVCNEQLGKLYTRPFADAYQGNYWCVADPHACSASSTWRLQH
jgi:hypothetical protein